MTGRMKLACVALFAVVGFAIYSNVIIKGNFIYDDYEYVVENSLLESPPYAYFSDPRQVGYLSFALDHALWGDNPSAYHFVNVLIHVINSLLVLLLTGRLLRAVGAGEGPGRWNAAAAFLSGFIFLVHPVHTQAVSYITQRFASLCTLFYLLSVLLYLDARSRREADRIGYLLYGLSLLSCLLAMKTKEIAFTIPVVLLIFEFLLLGSSTHGRRRFLFLIPYAVIMLTIPLSIFGPDWGLIKPAGGIAEVVRIDKVNDLIERSPLAYFFTQLRVVAVYLRLLFLPVNLKATYDLKASYSFLEARVILSLLLLLLVAGGAYYLWKKARSSEGQDAAEYRVVSLGILWFFVTVSVESSFIPIKDLIFEHRVYLPAFGIVAGASVMLARALRKTLPPVWHVYGLAVATAVIGMVFGAGTYLRNDVWTDDLKFWGDVIKKSPDKAIAYNNRAAAYGRIGRLDLALLDLDRTISYFSRVRGEGLSWENADFTPHNMAKAYTNRGQIYEALGEPERAREDFRRARQVMDTPPPDIPGSLRRGEQYYERGAFQHAIREYNEILAWEPDQIDALNNRGNAYSRSGRYYEAVADFNRVISLNPDFVLAYHNRGVAYGWLRKKDPAIKDFEQACSMGFQPACESIELVRQGKQ